MKKSILNKLEKNLENEKRAREAGDCTPERARFIELKFDSKEELEAGREVFNALLGLHATNMLISGISDFQLKPFKGITVDDQNFSIKYDMFGEIPITSLQKCLEIVKRSIQDKAPRMQISQDSSYYTALFTKPEYVDANLQIYSALAKLHDPDHFREESLFTVKSGVNQRFGTIPPHTPLLLVEEETYKKIFAAEKGEQHGRDQRPQGKR